MTTPTANNSDCNALAATALDVEDFGEASNALLELKKKSESQVGEVALRILRESIGDVFYRAFAFEILYSVALNDAISYIDTHAVLDDPYIMGAMLESVTEECGALEGQEQILKAVVSLRKALTLRTAEDLGQIAIQASRFEEAYPALKCPNT